ncbi:MULTISPECIES: GNAT family N-acetyltransferase [Streptomyces]|uniref:GNAT family N-acetyltransferase n=1 Tax=Streptomyces lycopersici TaxID=2974589 RepID=UPI0021CEF67E|nr:GNAT family protein [Streptomyces sp. NEAU-383]
MRRAACGQRTYEIGVGVLPEHRGQGVGTAAQKLLVDYLLDRTTANRVEALTNGGNISEHKALERLEFHQEGVMRGRSFQHDEYVDVLAYRLLRSEHRPGMP